MKKNIVIASPLLLLSLIALPSFADDTPAASDTSPAATVADADGEDEPAPPIPRAQPQREIANERVRHHEGRPISGARERRSNDGRSRR